MGQNKQRGFLLMVAVFLIVAAAVIATVIAYLVVAGTGASVGHLQSSQALFIAESGFERAARVMLSPNLSERVACANITGTANLTNVGFGEGEFTVTETNGGVAHYNGGSTTTPAVTSLSAALTSNATTIRVGSVTGYPQSGGRILIDREVIDYSSTSTDDADCGGTGTAPCLLGARRGRDGSTAKPHVSGTRVGQYQCALQSQGGVASLASAKGKRILRQALQMQEAWVVGPVASGATGDFNAVHCTASDDCWAVGDSGVIAQWDGASWNNVSSPTGQDINDVFCVAANDCWAVADRSGNNFVYVRWDGTSWSTVTLNSSNRENLNGIYCTASNNCWAVGNNRNNRFIITRWNGTAWSDASILDPPGPVADVDLNAVYCVAANDCWAVGDRQGNNFSFVRWDGSSWTASRLGSGNRENLNGVYCTASNNCWAVGQDRNNRLIILRWNGTAWSDQSFNPPGNSRDLNDVFCANANDCWAVADRDGNNFVFARWNGSSWSKYTVLDAANREDLFGLYCVATDDCWAVGAGDTFIHWDGSTWSVSGATPTLRRWNTTTWSSAGATLPSGLSQPFRDISMLSYADGWIVGNRQGGNATILRWNGSGWVSTPPVPARNRHLFGVYAVSANDTWAVGQRRGCPPNPSRVTILRWNGTAWLCSSVPSRATIDVNLRAVYMLDTDNDGVADDGWAVGDRSGNNFTLLRWNNSCNGASTGTNSWAYCPLNSANRERLNAVYCNSATDCWAVGQNRNNRFIIVRWDGTSWSDASIFNPTNDQDLNDIVCTASDNCWAVGDDNGNNFTFMRWNGTAWSLVAVADVANNENLNGVACTHANDCWAVGNERSNNFILVHWDGSSWTAQPDAGASANQDLNAIDFIGHRQFPQAAWWEQFQ